MKTDDLSAPYVAIIMITYNHGKYIEQAIESVMVQEAGFTYKLYIGEDCSTDNTREICISMKQKYPEKIELVLNEKNLGHSLNGFNFFNMVLGVKPKYIAALDGDDYWIDEKKLQKQVDILDANPDLSLCFTRINVLNESKNEITPYIHDNGIPVRTNFARFIETGRPHNTCTAFYRADRLPGKMPDWFAKTISMDWVINVILLLGGDAFFLQDITAVYRVHNAGVVRSTSDIKMKENSVFTIVNLLSYFYPKHQEALGNVLSWTYFDIAFLYLNEFNLTQFLKNVRNAKKAGEHKTPGWYWYTVKKTVKVPLRKIYHKIRR